MRLNRREPCPEKAWSPFCSKRAPPKMPRETHNFGRAAFSLTGRRATRRFNRKRRSVLVEHIHLGLAGAHDEAVLGLLTALRQLAQDEALEARVVAHAVPGERGAARVGLHDAVDGQAGVALRVEGQVLLDLGRAHVADDLGADLQVARQLPELVGHLRVVGVREVRHVVGHRGQPGRLGEAQQAVKRHHLDVVLRALGDVELGREALDAALLEHGEQLLLVQRRFELDFSGNMGQVARDLHESHPFLSGYGLPLLSGKACAREPGARRQTYCRCSLTSSSSKRAARFSQISSSFLILRAESIKVAAL